MKFGFSVKSVKANLSPRRAALVAALCIISLPLSAGFVTYGRGDGGGSAGTHTANLDADAQTNGFFSHLEREAAISLGYSGTSLADARLYNAAKGRSSTSYPTQQNLTDGNGDNLTANHYEADCDDYIASTPGVSGGGCADLTKAQFTSVRNDTDLAKAAGYDNNTQYQEALLLGYARNCTNSDIYLEALGRANSACDGEALAPPTADNCSNYIGGYSLTDDAGLALSGCGVMTKTQYASFKDWLSGEADADARENCYENDLERTAAVALGYDAETCADGKLYARALGRRLVNHPSEVLLQIAFASGATNTNVQIASNQYEADCDNYIAGTDGVTGDGCADLTRSQFFTIRSNHDTAQNDGFGSSQDRTAALAASPPHATGCNGANDYYVSVGSLSNPTLNPACALDAPFTGIAGPGCWESITDVTWYQHQNYDKDDFACVLRNTDTTSARFADTALASLTDGEFLYLKECFYGEGNSRTVQGLRDCATSASEWDQALFPLREVSNAQWGSGDTSGSCNLTLEKIEALGAFDDLNEGTHLSATKSLFDGDHCRRVNAAGEEVNCKEIVCDAIKNPPSWINNSLFSNQNYLRQHMCGQVNRAFKQKAYHYKIKKHFFVEACQASVIANTSDFDIVNWPMVKGYRAWYGITRGRAPNQNQNYSGISYYYDAGPESWETEQSLTMGRFEHSAIQYGSKPYLVSPSAGSKDLKVYAFGNVGRHLQTTWGFDVEFNSNLCISSGRYQDHNSYPNTGNWGTTQNFYRKPFPVSILPNEVDAARNTRQRGAIDSADSTMNVALVGSTAGTVTVGNMQAASTGQTAFERNHFKGTAIGAVKITSLPALGTLTYRASAVTANQILPSGDLSELKYEPPTGAPAINNNYTSFTFRNYAPWSSVETAYELTTFACHEVPDFETEAPPIPSWAWTDKSSTNALGAHGTGGVGNWNQSTCSGQSNAAITPGDRIGRPQAIIRKCCGLSISRRRLTPIAIRQAQLRMVI